MKAEPDAELFVEPPCDGGGGFRELHDVLEGFPGSIVPGFFTLRRTVGTCSASKWSAILCRPGSR